MDPSSGLFLEHVKEISFGGSATMENMKIIATQTFQSMMEGAGIARGWIPETIKEQLN